LIDFDVALSCEFSIFLRRLSAFAEFDPEDDLLGGEAALEDVDEDIEEDHSRYPSQAWFEVRVHGQAGPLRLAALTPLPLPKSFLMCRSKAAEKKFRYTSGIEVDEKEYTGRRVSAEALLRDGVTEEPPSSE
jgi:hypothetical protein